MQAADAAEIHPPSGRINLLLATDSPHFNTGNFSLALITERVPVDIRSCVYASSLGEALAALRAANFVIYREPTQDDYAAATTRFEEMGKKFCVQGQALRSVEWRTALELPSDLIVREARAADVILVGPRRS